MELATSTVDAEPRAPGFQGLLGTDGKRYSLGSFEEARVLVVVFTSNGCPTVRAYEDRLAEIQRRFADRGVRLLAVNSNDPHLSPGDAYPEMVRRARERGLPFPYVKDGGAEMASAYEAICTPHAFVFDEDRRLRYQGRVDDARDPARVTSSDLANAIEDLVAGRDPAVPETQPFGCSIVW